MLPVELRGKNRVTVGGSEIHIVSEDAPRERAAQLIESCGRAQAVSRRSKGKDLQIFTGEGAVAIALLPAQPLSKNFEPPAVGWRMMRPINADQVGNRGQGSAKETRTCRSFALSP
jgi:hypothetical protein